MKSARKRSKRRRDRRAVETALLLDLLGSYENYGQVRDRPIGAGNGAPGSAES